jgi:hypothetical protein
MMLPTSWDRERLCGLSKLFGYREPPPERQHQLEQQTVSVCQRVGSFHNLPLLITPARRYAFRASQGSILLRIS